MEGFWLAGEKGSFLSDGQLLQSSCGRNMPFKAKKFSLLLSLQLLACLALAEFPFVVL